MKVKGPGVRGTVMALCLWGLASRADAHLVETGLGPFYDGIGHFFVTPEAVLPVLALALLSGLRGREHGRAALLALLGAWAVCGAAGLAPAVAASGVPTWLGRFAGLPLVVLGVLAAIDPALSVRVVAWLALFVGAQLGVESGAAMAQTSLGLRGLAGTVLAVAVLATLATAFVATGTSRLLARRIARVAGSWLAASGLLLLGWSLR
ncbi:hypothetical protein [Variovorax sp. GT1P44]|uniref:hypothetical protein n=1 Tax=Variovorax sp. GT1P44 TaxID=3443742 RepID=UPI003F47428E